VKVLIVDDDARFRDFVGRGLASAEIESETAESGEDALQLLADRATGYFDLFLLDILMPGIDGWELLEQIRKQGDNTPVIFLTARGTTQDRVTGLNLGADDYIIKPFDLAELLARMDSVMRRYRSVAPLNLGPITINIQRRVLLVADREMEVPPKELDLLVALFQANGGIMSRQELLSKVWNINFDPKTNTVDVCVGRLRRKLGAEAAAMLQTVVGQGYRLVPIADE
jgi:DNA-binding response OmpR family regulator